MLRRSRNETLHHLESKESPTRIVFCITEPERMPFGVPKSDGKPNIVTITPYFFDDMDDAPDYDIFS